MESWEEINFKKEYLKAYKKMVLKEQRLQEDLQAIRASSMFVKAIEYSDMPKGNNNNKDLSDFMVAMEEKIEELKEQYFNTVLKKLEIKKTIREMNNKKLQEILELQYVEFLSLEEAAERLGYSYRHAKRINQEALKKINVP